MATPLLLARASGSRLGGFGLYFYHWAVLAREAVRLRAAAGGRRAPGIAHCVGDFQRRRERRCGRGVGGGGARAGGHGACLSDGAEPVAAVEATADTEPDLESCGVCLGCSSGLGDGGCLDRQPPPKPLPSPPLRPWWAGAVVQRLLRRFQSDRAAAARSAAPAWDAVLDWAAADWPAGAAAPLVVGAPHELSAPPPSCGDGLPLESMVWPGVSEVGLATLPVDGPMEALLAVKGGGNDATSFQ